MGELISVIIPVYKVEAYLSKCLDSVINQTYENLEIILVDDGSPDKCGEICDMYAERDNRIKVFHKPNGGLSDARNFGMKHATADYINFIDSDDWVDEKYISTLYELLIDNGADISAMSLCSVDHKDAQIGRAHTRSVKIMDDKSAIESMFSRDGLPWCAQAKLYKRELFSGIEYPVGVLMEDKATTYKLFAKCKRIVYADLPYYKYLVRQGSIMRSEFSEKRLRSFDVQEELNRFIEINYPQYKSLTYAYTVKVAVSTLCMMSAASYTDMEMSEKFFDYLSSYTDEFLYSSVIDKRFKLVGCFMIVLRKILGKKIYSNSMYIAVCKKVSSVIMAK